MDNELKPCPFCGSEVKIEESYNKPTLYKIHHYCKTNIPKTNVYNIVIDTRWFALKQDVIKAWNNRED